MTGWRWALGLGGIAVALAWGGLLAGQHLAGRDTMLGRLEAPLEDIRTLIGGQRAAPPEVVIVAIDDEAVAAFGRFPIPRERLAEVVRAIARSGAKAIGIDLLLVQPGSAEGDAALAQAMTSVPVVLAAAATFDREPDPAGGSRAAAIPVATGALWPIDRFREVAATGFANVALGAGGVPRHIPTLITVGDAPRPSFAIRVATAALGQDAEFTDEGVVIGSVRSALDRSEALLLRFYGPRGTIRTVGAARLLADPSGASLAGRVVLIGPTVLGGGDTFTTPFDPVMPGVEVMATAVAHLLTGDGLVRTNAVRRLDAAAIVAFPLLAILVTSLGSTLLGAGLAALIVSAWALAASAVFIRSGIALNMTLPIAATLPVATLHGVSRRWVAQRETRRLQSARTLLRRFQPPALADRLEHEPDFLAEPVAQDAAIVFVDLTGFTGLAERLGRERTQEMLRLFHAIVDEEVGRAGGLVLTYMGDGAMAAFGVPSPSPTDAGAAIAAATALGRRLTGWIPEISREAGLVRVKIGAHCGPLMVSRLGGASHQHITVTGDVVNVASRLQEVAARHGVCLACSDDLVRSAAQTAMGEFGEACDVAIRGRAQPIRVRFWQAEQRQRYGAGATPPSSAARA